MIVGHRDPGLTDCPGQDLYDQLDGVRREVSRRIVLGPRGPEPRLQRRGGKPKLMVMSRFGASIPVGRPDPLRSGGVPRLDIVRDVELLPGGTGGYTLDGFGGMHTFGGLRPAAGPCFAGRRRP